MGFFLTAPWDGIKGLLIAACYTLTMMVSALVSWTLYARSLVLPIYPILATSFFIAPLILFFSLLLRRYRRRGASAFKAEEARIQRICNPLWRVTEEDLIEATANFSCQKIIGRGRFGTVYRGILSNGQTVAIKRINLEEPLAKKHFLSELHILGQLRHRNLLRILGFFHNAHEMILIFKFMPNLNLDILLHGPQDCRLNWRQRLKIAVGVAYGLEYLHHGCRNAIVHCDVKPANIFLDEHLEPHLADFGLAKIIRNNQRTQNSLGSSLMTFTVGYAAPGPQTGTTYNTNVPSNVQDSMSSSFLYLLTFGGFGKSETVYLATKTSPKSDVYSYGILLLELITGLRPTSSTLMEMGVTISQWARNALAENNCNELIDVCIKNDSEFHAEIQRVLRIGIQCTCESPEIRPAMNDVVKRLEEIMGIERQWNNIPLYDLAYQEKQMEDRLLPSCIPRDANGVLSSSSE